MPSKTTLLLVALVTSYNVFDADGKCGNRELIISGNELKWCGIFVKPEPCNKAYTEKMTPFKECEWNNGKCIIGSDCPADCSQITTFGNGIVSQGKLGDCSLDVQMVPGSTCNVKCDETKGYSAQAGTYICPQRGGTATTSLRCTIADTTAAPTASTVTIAGITTAMTTSTIGGTLGIGTITTPTTTFAAKTMVSITPSKTMTRSKTTDIMTEMSTFSTVVPDSLPTTRTAASTQDIDDAGTATTIVAKTTTHPLLRRTSHFATAAIGAVGDSDNPDAAPGGTIVAIIIAIIVVLVVVIIIAIVVIYIRKKKKGFRCTQISLS